jgi:hypothetical protein
MTPVSPMNQFSVPPSPMVGRPTLSPSQRKAFCFDQLSSSEQEQGQNEEQTYEPSETFSRCDSHIVEQEHSQIMRSMNSFTY